MHVEQQHEKSLSDPATIRDTPTEYRAERSGCFPSHMCSKLHGRYFPSTYVDAM